MLDKWTMRIHDHVKTRMLWFNNDFKSLIIQTLVGMLVDAATLYYIKFNVLTVYTECIYIIVHIWRIKVFPNILFIFDVISLPQKDRPG